MKYLYMHGLGQTPDSWERTAQKTNVSGSSVYLSLSEMLGGKTRNIYGIVFLQNRP